MVSPLSPFRRFTTQECSSWGFRVKKTLSMRTHVSFLWSRTGPGPQRGLNILAAALVVVVALNHTAGQVETGRGSRAAQRFWTANLWRTQAIAFR
jgi:hypothetical protein